MKWENRDFNVVEWTNIPKFSTLDDIVTPPSLLELFFDIFFIGRKQTKKHATDRKTANFEYRIAEEKRLEELDRLTRQKYSEIF